MSLAAGGRDVLGLAVRGCGEPALPRRRRRPDRRQPFSGRAIIHLSPEKRQLIGLTLAPVECGRLVQSLRTAAVVEHDETRFYRVAPRFAGWVGKLHVNFTGAPVEHRPAHAAGVQPGTLRCAERLSGGLESLEAPPTGSR